MIDSDETLLLQRALALLDAAFAGLPAWRSPGADVREWEVLEQVVARLGDEHPYGHPLYAGQMQRPPHRIARLAYALTLWLNPNNHALDGGRASTGMEQEAVADIAAMFGWDAHLGHLCSGGTVANLEALWIASKARPGRTLFLSEQAHYAHRRAADMLHLDLRPVAVDGRGAMDVEYLEWLLRQGMSGTVVATLGTTALGALDPLPDIVALARRYDLRVHVDAAYGGYFTLVEELDPAARSVFDALTAVDSIVVDPHKHGLQPYGCSCVLFRDPSLAALYTHEAPYAYYADGARHQGETGLECSRAGAAAVALWATQRLLPLARGGAFARDLGRSLDAARRLHARLAADLRFLTLDAPALDIVVWAPRARLASAISARSHALYHAAAAAGLHLALVALPASLLRRHWPEVDYDTATVTCVRSCLMKPEHADWLERIWAIVDEAANRHGARLRRVV